eukprot:9466999-Pyramimonas_sp.AAC.1
MGGISRAAYRKISPVSGPFQRCGSVRVSVSRHSPFAGLESLLQVNKTFASQRITIALTILTPMRESSCQK